MLKKLFLEVLGEFVVFLVINLFGFPRVSVHQLKEVLQLLLHHKIPLRFGKLQSFFLACFCIQAMGNLESLVCLNS